jgi:hypothetical protein
MSDAMDQLKEARRWLQVVLDINPQGVSIQTMIRAFLDNPMPTDDAPGDGVRIPIRSYHCYFCDTWYTHQIPFCQTCKTAEGQGQRAIP